MPNNSDRNYRQPRASASNSGRSASRSGTIQSNDFDSHGVGATVTFKKFIIGLCVVALLFGVLGILLGTAIGGGKSKAAGTPTNIQIINVGDVDYIQWSHSNNASGYMVHLGSDNIKEVNGSNSLSLGFTNFDTQYAIKIKSIGQGKFIDSAWTDTVMYFRPSKPNATKLATPSNLSVDIATKTLKWDNVPNATKYTVYIDSNSQETTSNSYGLAGLTTAGTYSLSVMALGDGNNFSNSDRSSSVSYTVVGNPGGGDNGGGNGGGDNGNNGGGNGGGDNGNGGGNNGGGGGNNGGGGSGSTSPDAVEARFKKYIDRNTYENDLFPYRFGTDNWKANGSEVGAFYSDPADRNRRTDYYSYDNFIEALRHLATIKVTYNFIDDAKYLVQRQNTETMETINYGMPKAPKGARVETRVVDYGDFLNSNNENDNKRELSAFFANMSHESGAYGYIKADENGKPLGDNGQADPNHWIYWEYPDFNKYQWGFVWNEETSYINYTGDEYSDYSFTQYPPVKGHGYQGRGPIQLTWNYNYGFFSETVFGDKNVLLNNPERVSEEGFLGIMGAIWFWMTPQPPKASCHDIMLNYYQHDSNDQYEKYYHNCFGLTIIVVNGHYENNKGPGEWPQVDNRVSFYKRFAKMLNANIDGETLYTKGFPQWGGF